MKRPCSRLTSNNPLGSRESQLSLSIWQTDILSRMLVLVRYGWVMERTWCVSVVRAGCEHFKIIDLWSLNALACALDLNTSRTLSIDWFLDLDLDLSRIMKSDCFTFTAFLCFAQSITRLDPTHGHNSPRLIVIWCYLVASGKDLELSRILKPDCFTLIAFLCFCGEYH